MMTKRQTQCPECQTVYIVTVLQMTAAQGMVCCPKCSATFNAIQHLTAESITEEQINDSENKTPITTLSTINTTINPRSINNTESVLDLFESKAQYSNLNLTTYLNNLNFLTNDPIQKIPSLNLNEKYVLPHHKNVQKRNYLLWGGINFVLIGILSLLVLLLPDPSTNRYFFKSIHVHFCGIFNCKSVEQQYRLIKTTNIETRGLRNQNTTLISGELINSNPSSLPLPNIKVILMSSGNIIYTDTFQPEEYLIQNLVGISRIPNNTSFYFHIYLPIERKKFDHYKIEITKP